LALAELDLASVQNDKDAQQASLNRTTKAAHEAIQTYENAGPELLKDLNARSHRANCYEISGKAFLHLKEYDKATISFENAIQEMQWVCSRNPLVYRYRKMLSFYQFQLANCYFENELQAECVEAMREFRATLVEVLRATPENKKSAEWFVDVTLGITQIVGTPTTENIPILQSILSGAISDLQNLIQESSEYDWLTPKVDELKSALRVIEAGVIEAGAIEVEAPASGKTSA